MEKYLITGFSGFVSRYFLEYLENNKIHANVLGIDMFIPSFDLTAYKNISCTFEKADLLDKSKIDNVIYQFQPNYILHLASYSSVAFSWKDPISSFRNNTNIFLNLLEVIRALNLDCRILSIGSSEEYGNVNENDLPLKEDHVLKPISPYAVARVSQEMLSKVFTEGYGMDIVMTRSFNHLGPRQKDIFAIPSFARQLVEIKRKGLTAGQIETGDVNIIRDFLDVRDVVRAYHMLLKNAESGEVYNVCSGHGTTLYDIIITMAELLNIEVKLNVNSNLLRPNDNRAVIGSNEKIRNRIGWINNITLRQTLLDILKYWEENE